MQEEEEIPTQEEEEMPTPDKDLEQVPMPEKDLEQMPTPDKDLEPLKPPYTAETLSAFFNKMCRGGLTSSMFTKGILPPRMSWTQNCAWPQFAGRFSVDPSRRNRWLRVYSSSR